MLETAKNTLLILSALFPIVNPLGGSPIFLTVTQDYSASARRALSWRVALNSFILLVCSFLIGTHILTFFGISLPVVQIGGGLIVISTGWTILNHKDDEPAKLDAGRNDVSPQDEFRSAFYPLTLPLTVGPGSISVAVTLGANLPRHGGGNILGILEILIGSAIIAASIYVCYGFSDKLARAIGATSMSVIMRLSAFLLVCIGVQILWNGARALLVTIYAPGQ